MKKINNQSGQSTVEFIFTFAFGVSIIFMVFNSALNYSTGYLVHYATYMASRAYLTSDSYAGTVDAPERSMQDAETAGKARDVYAKYMLDVFKVGTDKFEINKLERGMTGSEYLTVGGKTKFEQRIDAIGKITGQTEIELVSESFLGHEPTRAQCAARVCFAITNTGSCDNNLDITLYDNGC